jgi:HSP20 family molecular chaperone IbpA
VSRLNVKKVSAPSDRALPIFAEFDRLAEQIRVQAYNLFARRGASDGHELEDWLAAERELCWPAAELVERKDEFVVSVALAGFEPAEIDVTATPREILIKGERKRSRKGDDEPSQVRWSEFRSSSVLRRVELPSAIDLEKISANLENGLLRVIAPKAGGAAGPAKRVEVGVAG